MSVDLIYSFCEDEVIKPVYCVLDDEDDGSVKEAGVWVTDGLNFSFHTMEDLEKVIKALQGLRRHVKKHMMVTGKDWVPTSMYGCTQNVDVRFYDVQYAEINVQQNGEGSTYFEALSLADRKDGNLNGVTLYFPHGQKDTVKKFAEEILNEAQKGEDD